MKNQTEEINENGITFYNNQLSYCGRNCTGITPALWRAYGPNVYLLDLSYNSITTLAGLEHFPNLEELILDNNKLDGNIKFPSLPRLKTLSLNNNQISDLEPLVNQIAIKCPHLTYLSLLRNKACPNQLSDRECDDLDYQNYRYYVLHRIPRLRFLDSRLVSGAERREAPLRGPHAHVRRPTPTPPLASVAANRPLPLNLNALGKHTGTFRKYKYSYSGKHSEGNRFILNSDL